MKRSEQEQLLKAVIGGDELAGLREASLASGLSSLRSRRRRRLLLRATALALVPALIILAAVWFEFPRSESTDTAVLPDTLTAAPRSGVRLISDDELLDLFPGRPVALIGRPGEQRLVFLDEEKR